MRMAPSGLSDLPIEALDSIARRVGALDNVTCSAVCKPWRRALNTARLRGLRACPHYVCVEPRYVCSSFRRRETVFGQEKEPWIGRHICLCSVSRIMSGEEKQTWTRKVCLRPIGCGRLQDMVGVVLDTATGKNDVAYPTRVIGCNYGWVITVDKACGLALVEPPTGRRFPLPPITSSLGRSKKVLKNIQLMGQDMFRKAALAPGRRLGTYAVMLIHSGGYGLSFLAPAATCWTALRAPAWAPKNYLDVVFHKGIFYTVSVDLELNAWEPDGSCTGLRARLAVSPRTEPMWAVLVESTTRDDLLMVSAPVHGPGLYAGMSVNVSRYDESEGRWTPAINWGDTTILVKENSGLCVSRLGGALPPRTAENWHGYVSYSSNLSCHMTYDCLFLRDGCWFLPYCAPVMPHN